MARGKAVKRLRPFVLFIFECPFKTGFTVLLKFEQDWLNFMYYCGKQDLNLGLHLILWYIFLLRHISVKIYSGCK